MCATGLPKFLREMLAVVSAWENDLLMLLYSDDDEISLEC